MCLSIGRVRTITPELYWICAWNFTDGYILEDDVSRTRESMFELSALTKNLCLGHYSDSGQLLQFYAYLF